MAVLARPLRSSRSKPFICVFILYLIIPFATPLPFIVLHGISDSCTGSGLRHFIRLLEDRSGSKAYCIVIGNGSWDSWFVPLIKQMEIACEKVKSIQELGDGYNIVALSQGNMVARGLIEFCSDGPPVKNYISLAGPHAGIASIPYCGVKVLCLLGDYIMELMMYTRFVQEHFAPSNYMKIPTDIKGYQKGCKYLPTLNNERSNTRNSTYAAQFASLENLILVMFKHDLILVPKETSWFGYFRDGSLDTILPPNKTLLYMEDWIGLRSLEEAGKVKFVTAPGAHLHVSKVLVEDHILPYLRDKESLHEVVTRSSSYTAL